MDLKISIDRARFNGIIALGDIHADLSAAVFALQYARENRLFVVFIGDLFDGGEHPYETVELAKMFLDENSAVLTIGNHEHKMYRHATGEKVRISGSQIKTFEDCGENLEAFLQIVRDLVTHPKSDYYHYFGKTLFVHAACHPNLWSIPDQIDAASKQLALYGEVSTAKNKEGYPVRSYKWTDYVPDDHSVIVGHDRHAMDKKETRTNIVTNQNGGETYFIDTGCGKTKVKNGVLTGAIFFFVDGELDFAKFIPFS